MLIDPNGTATRKIDPQLAQKIKLWVSEALRVEEDASLMVTEMRCTTPDCLPIKTVIAILQAASPTRQYKIHKPMAEILFDDVKDLTSVQPKIIRSSL